MREGGRGGTKRRGLGWGGVHPRPRGKGDPRPGGQPPPPLGLVDAKPLQPPLQVTREGLRVTALVVEREHGDAARLAVPPNGQEGRMRSRCRLPQLAEDPRDLVDGAMAEERQRDVQVAGRHDPDIPHVAEGTALPLDELVDRVRREPERAEEAYAFTSLEASSGFRACLCQLCARSVRTRWSAAAVARPRTAARSPGRLSSRAALPSGPSACR